MEHDYRASMAEKCPSCGWPRRYHAGAKATGRLLVAPNICAGFEQPKPTVVTKVTVVFVPRIARAA